MAVNTLGKLEITDLDFDAIKTNLKTYLNVQDHRPKLKLEIINLSTCMVFI